MLPAQPQSPIHSESQASARVDKLTVMASRMRAREWDQLAFDSVLVEIRALDSRRRLMSLNVLVNFDYTTESNAHSEIQLPSKLCLLDRLRCPVASNDECPEMGLVRRERTRPISGQVVHPSNAQRS